jgi:hypothetical protein
MLFLAANHTQSIPVKTPHHSNQPVAKRNCFRFSLNPLAINNIFQKYEIDVNIMAKGISFGSLAK